MGDSATDRRPTAAPSRPASRFAACSCSSAPLRDFLIGQELPSFELRWAFERNRRFVPPDALQIGIAPRGTGRRPCLAPAVCSRRGVLGRGIPDPAPRSRCTPPAHSAAIRVIGSSCHRSIYLFDLSGRRVDDAKMAIHQLLDELHALVFEDLLVRFDSPIERHAASSTAG